LRDVTDEDVERLSGVMSGISTTRTNVFGQEVPNKIIVQKESKQTFKAPKPVKETKKIPFKQKAAERAVVDLLNDPLGYLRSIVGKEDETDVGKASFDNNILRVTRTVGRGKNTEAVTEQYDLTNKNDIKKIARDLYEFKSGKSQEVFEYIDQYVDSIPEKNIFDEFEEFVVKE